MVWLENFEKCLKFQSPTLMNGEILCMNHCKASQKQGMAAWLMRLFMDLKMGERDQVKPDAFRWCKHTS